MELKPLAVSEKSDLTPGDYRALGAFRYQIRRFLHFSEAAAQAEGIEPQQHQLLLAVRALDGQDCPTVRMIADHLLIRHHSAVGLIDRMAGRGMVERLPGETDRRQVRIRLTTEGETVLQRLSRVHREELRSSGPLLVEALSALVARAPVSSAQGKECTNR